MKHKLGEEASNNIFEDSTNGGGYTLEELEGYGDVPPEVRKYV